MTVFGIIVSSIYVMAITVLRWSSFPKLSSMPLNEFGDFLAGVFGPLTLFWLIMSFIQTQKELSQNTNALKLQADELKNSVNQYKEMVKTTRKQLELDAESIKMENEKLIRENEPYFTVKSSETYGLNENHERHHITLINRGKTVSNIKISTEPRMKFQNSQVTFQTWNSEESKSISWENKDNKFVRNFVLTIEFENYVSKSVTHSFNFTFNQASKKWHASKI